MPRRPARDLLAQDRRGATAVEFALLLPVMLTLLMAVLETGRALWLRQDMQFAVEEAARFALVEPSATVTAISAKASSRVAVGTLVATALDADSVTVTATADFAPVVPGLLPPGTVTLSARARLPR